MTDTQNAVLSRDPGAEVVRRTGTIGAACGAIVLGLLVPLALLGAWTISALTGALPEQILPSPRVVFETI